MVALYIESVVAFGVAATFLTGCYGAVETYSAWGDRHQPDVSFWYQAVSWGLATLGWAVSVAILVVMGQ